MQASQRMARCVALAALLISGSSFAQVYKCVRPDGKIEFSNLACPTDASASRVNTKPNSVDMSGSREQAQKAENSRLREQLAEQERAQQLDRSSASRAGSQVPPVNTCPTDKDIRNMETSASSIGLGKDARTFLEDEIRRARQCRKGQGNYSAEDWQISKEARDAQRSISGKKQGQVRAEGMHSAADPIEGDRIEQRKLAEEARLHEGANRERRSHNVITNCDSFGCTNAAGQRFIRSGNSNTYFGPNGACMRTGMQLLCPKPP